eukprot:GHVR01145228.1.p3 GENE.GHVR01145228.1~~GHVR01145228.1.p3  ORF type:complete len:128 (+),score=10.75 GHVR01145228.1:158-541(+)
MEVLLPRPLRPSPVVALLGSAGLDKARFTSRRRFPCSSLDQLLPCTALPNFCFRGLPVVVGHQRGGAALLSWRGGEGGARVPSFLVSLFCPRRGFHVVPGPGKLPGPEGRTSSRRDLRHRSERRKRR